MPRLSIRGQDHDDYDNQFFVLVFLGGINKISGKHDMEERRC